MRDASIIKMQQANAKRSGLLLAQFEFLQTRQDAMENVLKASSIVQRIKFAIYPDIYFRVVDAVQLQLINESNRKLDEARAKPHIEFATSLPS